MRISGLAVLSPAHLPIGERDAIESVIRSATHRFGRAEIDYCGIAVETHRYGFFLNTAAVLEDEKPPLVSAALWNILDQAERQGCDWVLFDRDEPVSRDLPLPV